MCRPALIEMGVDILNPVQTSAKGMDPVQLKQHYGDQIVFWGGSLDCQQTLPFGSAEDVAREVEYAIAANAVEDTIGVEVIAERNGQRRGAGVRSRIAREHGDGGGHRDWGRGQRHAAHRRPGGRSSDRCHGRSGGRSAGRGAPRDDAGQDASDQPCARHHVLPSSDDDNHVAEGAENGESRERAAKPRAGRVRRSGPGPRSDRRSVGSV